LRPRRGLDVRPAHVAFGREDRLPVAVEYPDARRLAAAGERVADRVEYPFAPVDEGREHAEHPAARILHPHRQAEKLRRRDGAGRAMHELFERLEGFDAGKLAAGKTVLEPVLLADIQPLEAAR
jgi:hypothetical protein